MVDWTVQKPRPARSFSHALAALVVPLQLSMSWLLSLGNNVTVAQLMSETAAGCPDMRVSSCCCCCSHQLGTAAGVCMPLLSARQPWQ